MTEMPGVRLHSFLAHNIVLALVGAAAVGHRGVVLVVLVLILSKILNASELRFLVVLLLFSNQGVMHILQNSLFFF